MKKLAVVGALVLCGSVLGASPGVAASSSSAVPAAARAACPAPPARYRAGAKGSMWFAACVTCKTTGPRELARRIGLSNNSASFVAHTYANRAVAAAQFRKFVALVGGKATARTILYTGCMAGFHARGRP
jgi:hypothetical protein